MGSMNIQASLLGRLRKAAKALVKREGFEASELETVLVFEKALSAPEIAEAWAELNRLRLGLHTSALRPGAFLLALGLTLGDLHLSLSAEKQDGTREIMGRRHPLRPPDRPLPNLVGSIVPKERHAGNHHAPDPSSES